MRRMALRRNKTLVENDPARLRQSEERTSVSEGPNLTDERPWHAQTIQDVAIRLGVDNQKGLTIAEALARLKRDGANRLKPKPQRPAWHLFIDQFKNLLIVILLGAVALAWAIGDLIDAFVILGVVMFNALLGFRQEYRAGQAVAALKRMLAQHATVRRDGVAVEVSRFDLVQGDVVLLDAGSKVPADGRIVVAQGLEIDESTLTGESVPAGKTIEVLDDLTAPLADRANMAYMNSIVTRGRAELLVTATGMATEMGRLATMLTKDVEPPTPLQVQLDSLGKRLAVIAGVVVLAIMAAGLWRGEPWVQIVLTSIALAVAAIPEGLPAVVTVTLAVGMHRMARRGAILKRLSAAETLGCATVICSDKTGTLTMNQMTARALFFHEQRFKVSGIGYGTAGTVEAENDACPGPELRELLLPFGLCNDAELRDGSVIGDPTEGALLVLAAKSGLSMEQERAHLPRIAEVPFDSQNKFMASFHHDGSLVRVFVKGALEVLLDRCDRILTVRGSSPLMEDERSELLNQNELMARDGLRVLAIASATLPADVFDPEGNLLEHLQNLTFVGLAGLLDPPRAETRDAIALCEQAGIQVKMITGDHKTTASAIAEILGISGSAVTGAEIDAMSDEALSEKIESIGVFARVAPEHKVRLVDALQRCGHVVAMTGDGVNDAPAVKHAHMGIAMGATGTDVTKEAADMVLTDDNFATIVRAVREGRTIFDNIGKFVRFQLSTNIGALLTVSIAPALGMPLPFTAIQILWVNIIMDGPPAVALGVDPTRPGIMHNPPRGLRQRLLDGRLLIQLAGFGTIMALGTLGVLYHTLGTSDALHATTLAFTTFVLFQVFNVFNARSGSGSVFTSYLFTNRNLWFALAGVLGLQVAAVHWPPAQTVFTTTALSVGDWLLAAAVAASILLIEEGRKLVFATLGRPLRPTTQSQ